MKNIIYGIIGVVLLTVIAFRFSSVDFSKNDPGGIQFQRISFQDALTLAKKENKILFIDFYATWCDPCKMMKKTSFSNERVGAFYNSNFINISVDAEKGEGVILAKKYKVEAYPSLFFVDSKGEVINHSSGYNGYSELINLGKSVL